MARNEELSYFSGNGECDFVISENGTVKRLIQVTLEMEEGSGARKREFDGLLEAARATGCRDLTIVAKDEESEEVRNGLTVKIVPAWKFLLGR